MLVNKYDPIPVDTSDVVLPEELLALTEKIAANVHDVWAVGRISEGWTYGLVKDPEKKTTPLLVAYDELPDSEKAYDRNNGTGDIETDCKAGIWDSKDSLMSDAAAGVHQGFDRRQYL